MARRFGFGPGTPPMGPRMFGRGDLKYALLELLNERPKHGYELIKELEEKLANSLDYVKVKPGEPQILPPAKDDPKVQ